MDAEDRLFLQSLKEDIKEVRIENKQSHDKTEKHLEKTCDEIKEVIVQVALINQSLVNHLDDNKEERKIAHAHKINRPQMMIVVLTGLLKIVSIFSIISLS